MANTADYRIKKTEKGPLQRFKNQNLLLKKFGEVGLQVYKTITGKRTSEELRGDLGVDPDMFNQIISFMRDTQMIELEPVDGSEANQETVQPENTPEDIEPEPQAPPARKARTQSTLPPIEPEIQPEVLPEPPPKAKKLPEPEKEIDLPPADDEIKPIEFEEEPAKEEEVAPPKSDLETNDDLSPEDKDLAPEIPPADEIEIDEPSAPLEPPKDEEEEISPIHHNEDLDVRPNTEMSSVEKIIFDRYGDLGLKVYALIDGQRTAEEIMRDTGVTESKLVEILDFMDEQGIIKLDYPKSQPPPPQPPGYRGATNTPPLAPLTPGAPPPIYGQSSQPYVQAPPARDQTGFTPMTEGDLAIDDSGPVPNPLELPIKAPLDLVKGVQMRAKVLIKFGDKGSKLLELIDGKNDVIDIVLKMDLPLPTVNDMVKFLLENGIAIVKPILRNDVRKKYGEDGYAIYKRYGKEGLMLYELIGKDLTIKQMADKVTTDKAKVIEMFLFIHQVLGIELSIDRDVLAKQLGL